MVKEGGILTLEKAVTIRHAHYWGLSALDGNSLDDGVNLPLPDELILMASWVWRPEVLFSGQHGSGSISDAATTAAVAAPQAGVPQLVLSALTGQDAIVEGGGTNSTTTLADDNSDIAMGANLARSLYDVDGTGIKIGILSNSFNLDGGEAADIAAGNLPAADDIHILEEGSSGDDEGRAMAELVYKVAPGAQIYFYSGTGSETDFANGIQALANAGCQVIVDDITYPDEPFFEDGSVVQQAVENVINEGVSYFTSAGNVASDFYQHNWLSLSTTLPDVRGTVTAFDFGAADGGTSSPYENITIYAGGTCDLDLQWDQPFKSIGNSTGTDDSLSIYMFKSGSLVFSATTDAILTNGDPIQFLGVTNTGTTSVTVQIAIVDSYGPAPGLFKIIDENDEGVSGAVFDDPNAGIGSGTVIGQAMVTGANTVGAVNYMNTPAFGTTTPVPESFSSVGPGEFMFDSNGTRLSSPESAGKVDFTAPDGSATSVFDPFEGTSAAAPDAAAVAALMLQADPKLTPAQVTSDIESTALPMSGTSTADGAGFIQAVPAVQFAEQQAAACYAAGTLILTTGGVVPVELLDVGDRVVTLAGEMTVRWIGWRRIDLARHLNPEAARPIRFRRNAFADGSPRRDLLVSPEHGMFVDGMLIPARLLVNDGSIAMDRACESVVYYHLELDEHAIVFAEGAPAESYLDTGNRLMFTNGGRLDMLRPAFVPPEPKSWARDACAPLAIDAARVRTVWQRLAERSQAMGIDVRALAATDEPHLRIAVLGGREMWPINAVSNRYSFAVPPGNDVVRVRSRANSPDEARPWLADRRRLGVCVGRIVVHGGAGAHDISVDHPLLRDGWWGTEREGSSLWRWTDGDALLPLRGDAYLLELWLVGAMVYLPDVTRPIWQAA